MNLRQSHFILLSAFLLTLAAQADDTTKKAKKCTASARECEQAIRQMMSGRRYLGAQMEDLNPGLRVKTIVREGPAERADLKEGDRLMAVNGHSTVRASIGEFKTILSDARETGRLWIIVERGGVLKKVDVRLEPYSKAQIDKIVAQHLAESHSVAATTPQP